MKMQNKLLISVVAGMLAMLLYTTPAWWGVLFSPLPASLHPFPWQKIQMAYGVGKQTVW